MMCSPWSFLIELSWLQKIVGYQTRESLPLLIRAVTSLEGRLTPRPGSPIIPCLRGKVGVLYFCSFVHSARLTAPGRDRGFFHQDILLEKLIFFMWLLRVSLVKVDLREISKSISELSCLAKDVMCQGTRLGIYGCRESLCTVSLSSI